jgi:ActR/RegA family two-component response regulator
MLVDDDEPFRALLGRALEPFGLVCVGAQTARDALARDLHDTAVAVVSLRLPDASGLVVVEQLRKARPSLECIVVCACPPGDFVDAATSVGASEIFSKTSDVGHLAQAVVQLVSARAAATA